MTRSRGALAALAVLSLFLLLGPGDSAASIKRMYVTVHTVRPGEDTTALLRRYGVTRGTLESLNPELDFGALKPGSRVKVLSRSGVFQRLRPGLTLSDVADAYRVERDALLRENDINNPKRLRAGTEIFIPDGTPLSPTVKQRLDRRQRARGAKIPKSFLVRPLQGEGRLVMSDEYGWRNDPLTGLRQRHAGVDLVAPWGTPILAARDGRVKFAGWKGGYGKLVILEHSGGYETWYGHCTEFLVREGDQVTAGTPIARLGATGAVTAPHLHFELRQGGNTRNPAKYLAKWL